MAIQSTFLGSTVITGEDAKRFNRLVTHGRGNTLAQTSIANGRKLAAKFVRNGVISIALKPAQSQARQAA